jgi:hypothetical protein
MIVVGFSELGNFSIKIEGCAVRKKAALGNQAVTGWLMFSSSPVLVGVLD